MPAAAPTVWCRCGHLAVWHDKGQGQCEITGPTPTDGCGCRVFDATCQHCESGRAPCWVHAE